MKKYLPQFAAGYAILGVLLAVIVYGSVKVIFQDPASHGQVAKITRALNPTDAQIEDTACSYVVQDAATQGVIITSCKLAKIGRGQHNPEVSNGVALVSIDAKSKDTQFVVVVRLQKTAWRVDGAQVVGAVQKA